VSISRREFLGTGAAATVTLASEIDPKSGMPRRLLGKTAAMVSVLGIGTGPTATRKIVRKDLAELINRAIDLGISYIDTAVVYGHGASESGVGDVMQSRRKEVWLATKIQDRNYDNIMRLADASLKRLQTDHVDLLHIHNLGKADDLAVIESPNGPLQAFYKLRDQKVARFIGITSHTDPAVLRDALERHDFDCVQMSLNAAHSGAAANLDHSFEKLALPIAQKKNMGILAMKVFVGGRLAQLTPDETLLRYSLSLPVTAAVVGMPNHQMVGKNTMMAKAFRPLPPAEMKALPKRLGTAFRASLDHWFRHHQDA